MGAMLILFYNQMEKKFEGNTFNFAYRLMNVCFGKCQAIKYDNYNDECVSKLV